ncbi:MAG: HD domain-containing protein [Phycisphaeraceae bacterium]|nr:MAG: HD domain-containing protein [Phycisphaeraceae bacterium]
MEPERIQAIISQIERKDMTTAAHTWRVALYARVMAEDAGLERNDIDRITLGAALHDIGKLDVPGEILRKPGPLTDAEFAIVREHPANGHRRLLELGVDDEIVLDLVRHHHERWDGLGYPDGLAGEQIALGPRYFAVIDAFDAMTSARPYRTRIDGQAGELAMRELKTGAGDRYWPQAVEAFCDLRVSGRFDWIIEHFSDEQALPAFSADSDAMRLADSLRTL